ncbi:MAG TPA: hypothetical protein VNX68_17125 [Nitrosopumilaceae archaeon]|jgi:hypothetical protein|nr:hypothetical protein [Nitrosopumilaceae archaeon]
MGFFDLFKKKADSTGSTVPSKNSGKEQAATESEQKNHKRKSIFYKFAFVFFPKNLFAGTEATIMEFAKNQEKGLEAMLISFNGMVANALDKEDIAKCKLSYFTGFKGNKSVLVISFPDVDATTGNLFPVFGPYYSAIIYEPANLNDVKYFVLCQTFEGKTSFRELNAGGMNMNCGSGPTGTLNEELFLQGLEKLN